MFSQASLHPPPFKAAEDEVIYWKNLAFQLFKEIEELHQSALISRESVKRPESTTTASPAPKRHKVDSLDPLNFNTIVEDVQSLVWQHFTGNNLLAMSEVSKTWNKRVEAGINDKTILNLPNDIQKVQNSKFIRKFKSVSMLLSDITKLKALSLITDTAESLKVVIDEKIEPTNLNFKSLKCLDVEVSSIINNFSSISGVRIDQLEELKIRSKNYCDGLDHDSDVCPLCYEDYEFSETLHVFIRFFARLKNLKRLDLSECEIGFIWSMYTRSFYDQPQFKLETLKCDEYEPFDGESYKSLKVLTLVTGLLETGILSQFPHLVSLDIENCEGLKICPLRKSTNYNLKNLSIKFGEDFNFQQFMKNAMKFFQLIPELETFYITKLTSGLMRLIVGPNLKLKTLKYSEIEEGTLEQYVEMRQSGEPNINRNIQFIQEV